MVQDVPNGWSPDGSRILFTRYFAEDRSDLFLVTADGGALERVTDRPGKDENSSFAPDGRSITFCSDREGQDEIYRLTLDTWEVSHDSADWCPAVSPDGRWIAFNSTPAGAGASEIVITPTGGGQPRRLTDNGARDERPRWSPDGGRIAFQSDRDGQWELYLYDLESGEERRLTDDPAADERPDFSPDGDHLVFDSDRSGDVELYELRVAAPEYVRRLTESPGRDAYASYSPDGTRIALTSDRDGDPEIFVMDRDGRHPVQLTDNEAMDQAPRWSPDGATIVFFSNRDGDPEIYRMAADGARQLRLTISPDWDFMPVFSPDGQTIVFDSRRDGRRGLYAMRPDGSRPRRLTNRSRSPFLAALERGDPEALATLHLRPEEPPALEPELAVATRRALATDPDHAHLLASFWLRVFPFTPAREAWVHPHLEAVWPLLEARSVGRPEALAPLAVAAAKLGRDDAGELLVRARDALPDDPVIAALSGAAAVERLARQALADGTADRLAGRLEAEKATHPAHFGPTNERRLNALGYQLLGAGRDDEAVAVLRANAAVFPESANVWDSLGEAVWSTGGAAEAVRLYRRSLELDPRNDNARRMIETIRTAGGGSSGSNVGSLRR